MALQRILVFVVHYSIAINVESFQERIKRGRRVGAHVTSGIAVACAWSSTNGTFHVGLIRNKQLRTAWIGSNLGTGKPSIDVVSDLAKPGIFVFFCNVVPLLQIRFTKVIRHGPEKIFWFIRLMMGGTVGGVVYQRVLNVIYGQCVFEGSWCCIEARFQHGPTGTVLFSNM